MTSTPPDLAALDLGGVEIDELIREGEKSLLARGRHGDRPVMVKVLRTDEEFWRAKFAHEIRLYQAFALFPPPVRVPELVHTDGHAVLVVEHIPGTMIDAERYPEHPLNAGTVDAVLEAITGFAGWSPPAEVLAPVFDYSERVERYHRTGFFDTDDHAALRNLLDQVPFPDQPAHGDPLPSNLLRLDSGGYALVDFEFTGLYLRGFDLAMLHALLTSTPGAQDRIDVVVREAGIEMSFLINQAIVLSRELRLHAELPPGELREHRLALLREQWAAFRQRLHSQG